MKQIICFWYLLMRTTNSGDAIYTTISITTFLVKAHKWCLLYSSINYGIFTGIFWSSPIYQVNFAWFVLLWIFMSIPIKSRYRQFGIYKSRYNAMRFRVNDAPLSGAVGVSPGVNFLSLRLVKTKGAVICHRLFIVRKDRFSLSMKLLWVKHDDQYCG